MAVYTKNHFSGEGGKGGKYIFFSNNTILFENVCSQSNALMY